MQLIQPGAIGTGLFLLGLSAISTFGGCGTAPSPRSLAGLDDVELGTVYSLSPLPGLPASPGNRFADDEAAAQFGKALFFEKGLSAGNGVSCATCHIPQLYFTDAKPLSTGTERLKMHTPSVVGSQWSPFFNWDGRADSLWAQALGPMESGAEMGSTRLELAHFIAKNYRSTYEPIFGPLPQLDETERFPPKGLPLPGNQFHEDAQAWLSMDLKDRIAVNQVFANLGKAIEAYERKLVPDPAPFDRFVEALQAGDPTGAGHLSEPALRGLESFLGPAGCINCHNGPLFTDNSFHNIGLAPTGVDEDAPFDEVTRQLARGRAEGVWKVLGSAFRTDGRYGDAGRNDELEFLSPNFEDFLGAFRTPTLRNVAMTAPYGHGGQHEDLAEVIEWYRELPRVKMIGHRDEVLGQFEQSVDTGDLVAFLESLTGGLPAVEWLKPE